MPGIPQGRDIGEAGNKSVSLVSVADDGLIAVEERHLAMAQFERLSVECHLLSDWPDLIEALKHALHTARRDHAGEHLIVRPVLTGETSLAWRAGRDLDLLHAEAQNVAEQIGTLWIDKIELALSAVSNASTGGALEELAQIITQRSLPLDDPAVLEEVERLLKYVPRELRALLGDSQEERTATIVHAMQQGAKEVLARLEETDG
jgi:hypothetical protein